MTDDDRRAEWLRLIRVDLPKAAAERPHWPVHADHCFARIILDVVHGRPWRQVVAPPAWRNMTPEMLERACDLAKAILSDEVDLASLNRQSLMLRGKRQPHPQDG